MKRNMFGHSEVCAANFTAVSCVFVSLQRKVFLEKLSVVQRVKKFRVFY